MAISILLNIGILYPIIIVKVMIFQIKILNEISFFLIIIIILLQFKIVYVFSLKVPQTTAIQNG